MRKLKIQVGKKGENSKEIIKEMNPKTPQTKAPPEPSDLNDSTNAHTVYENVPQIIACRCDISEAQNKLLESPSEKNKPRSHKINCETA